MPLVILIGASGSGKTTIARAIEQRHADDVEVYYFDRIGVPSAERMTTEYGSIEGWQRAKTIEWMAKLAQLSKTRRRLIFEGQTVCHPSLKEPPPQAGSLICPSSSTAMMKPD